MCKYTNCTHPLSKEIGCTCVVNQHVHTVLLKPPLAPSPLNFSRKVNRLHVVQLCGSLVRNQRIELKPSAGILSSSIWTAFVPATAHVGYPTLTTGSVVVMVSHVFQNYNWCIDGYVFASNLQRLLMMYMYIESFSSVIRNPLLGQWLLMN